MLVLEFSVHVELAPSLVNYVDIDSVIVLWVHEPLNFPETNFLFSRTLLLLLSVAYGRKAFLSVCKGPKILRFSTVYADVDVPLFARAEL